MIGTGMRLADKDISWTGLRHRAGYQNIDQATTRGSDIPIEVGARRIADDGMSQTLQSVPPRVQTEPVSAPLPKYVYGSMVYDLGNARIFHDLDDLHWLHRQLPEICAELPTTLPRYLDGREPCFNVERRDIAKSSDIPMSVHMRWNDQKRRMLMFSLVSKVAPSAVNTKATSVKTGYVLSTIAEFLSAHCADALPPEQTLHWNGRIKDIYTAPHIHPGVKEMQTTKKEWPQYYNGLVRQLKGQSAFTVTV